MALHIVTGPPAAGKSTYVREHAEPGDIRIDYDEIANLLSGLAPGEHEHPTTVKGIATAARKQAIDAALKHCATVDVWIIHSSPSQNQLDTYARHNATVHVINPGRDTVMERIKHERPGHMHAVAAKWYEQHDPQNAQKKTRPKTTTARGLGWDHQKQRARLMRAHKDGTPCWWCGRGMFRDKAKNWDRQPLEADHSQARSQGGAKADRLLCSTCNRQRGDGSRDHLRPALTGHQPPATQSEPRNGFQTVAVTFT